MQGRLKWVEIVMKEAMEEVLKKYGVRTFWKGCQWGGKTENNVEKGSAAGSTCQKTAVMVWEQQKSARGRSTEDSDGCGGSGMENSGATENKNMERNSTREL